MSDYEIVDSSFTATIHAPIEQIDNPDWCFTLGEKEYQGCSPAHVAAGFTTAPDGRRMSINVEVIGGSLMVPHYFETLGHKDHLILESVSISSFGSTASRTSSSSVFSPTPASSRPLATRWNSASTSPWFGMRRPRSRRK